MERELVILREAKPLFNSPPYFIIVSSKPQKANTASVSGAMGKREKAIYH